MTIVFRVRFGIRKDELKANISQDNTQILGNLRNPTKLRKGKEMFSVVSVSLFTGTGEGFSCDVCGPVQTCSLGDLLLRS